MSNIVAIVGRPNVGKSTFFNRITGTRQAIVDPTSGVTRDRHYGKGEWNGIEFSLIDTGGYVENSDDVFEEEIRKQAAFAIEEANIILFIVDVQEGINPMDEDVARLLRESGKEVMLIVNNVDNNKLLQDTSEFYALCLGEIYSVSSINGSGTGDLLDELVKKLKPNEITDEPDLPRIAVVGRPNVGKSSLINAFLEEDKHIVTPVAGTTRDSIYTRYNKFGFELMLVDTAGLRKKAKVSENIEFYSVMRSIRSIESSDVCILMLDASAGFESQDMNIFRLIEKNHKGALIVVNKWDLIERQTNTARDFEKMIKERIAPFNDVPVIFTSVTQKQRIFKILEEVITTYKNLKKKINTAKLNEVLLPVIEHSPPPSVKGKYVKVKYITQLPTKFPAFVFFCNSPQYVSDAYKRFMANQIREKFDFTGAPIEIYFRSK
jgi:GTPase